MKIEQIINNNFKNLDWDDTTQAYYKLYFTPFMEIIYNSAKEYAKIMCEQQKEICANSAKADYDIINTSERATLFREDNIKVYVLKESILQCKNATEI